MLDMYIDNLATKMIVKGTTDNGACFNLKIKINNNSKVTLECEIPIIEDFVQLQGSIPIIDVLYILIENPLISGLANDPVSENILLRRRIFEIDKVDSNLSVVGAYKRIVDWLIVEMDDDSYNMLNSLTMKSIPIITPISIEEARIPLYGKLTLSYKDFIFMLSVAKYHTLHD